MNPATTDPRDQSIKLTCDSSCTTDGYYYWMKDGKYLRYTSSNNMLVLPSTEAGRYSCALDSTLKHHSSTVCECQIIHTMRYSLFIHVYI